MGLIQGHINGRSLLERSSMQNLSFAVWSGAHGCLQHQVFNVTLLRLCGKIASFSVALQKSLVVTLLFRPFVSLPMYYACKPIMQEHSWDPRDGIREYMHDFRQVLPGSIQLWL